MSRAPKPYEVSSHHSKEHSVRPSHLCISLFRTIQKQSERFLYTAWQGKAGAWLLRYVRKWGDTLPRTLILSTTTKPKKTLVTQTVKNQPALQKTWVAVLGWEDPLEEGMAIHSTILACTIPMDRGAWWGTVHGVTESDTTEQLSTGQQENTQR